MGTRPAGNSFQARILLEQSAQSSCLQCSKPSGGRRQCEEYTGANLHSRPQRRAVLTLEVGMEWRLSREL